MSIHKKVLVTGGAGFIGSHAVVELHAAGYLPIIIDNFSNSKRGILNRLATICGEEIPVIEADCRDLAAMAEVFEQLGTLHAVMHFAAFKAVGESVAKPAEYYVNNIGSLANLLILMQGHGVRNLVFSSSCTVYGQPDVLPVTEDAPQKPANSPYGYTKQVCEQLINDTVQAERGLRAMTLRYFNPIGAHPSGLIGELPLGVPSNLVPFITQVAAGLRARLSIFGSDYATPDGTAVRDYIHVVDLARAHVQALRMLDADLRETYNLVANVATGTGKSVLEAVQAFERATGRPLPYDMVDRRPGDVEAVWAAKSASKNLGDWEATHSLDDAMRDAWRWQEMLAQNPI
jgi:UDP-glucose 4-epimerase